MADGVRGQGRGVGLGEGGYDTICMLDMFLVLYFRGDDVYMILIFPEHVSRRSFDLVSIWSVAFGS